jgi:hypothetical protein
MDDERPKERAARRRVSCKLDLNPGAWSTWPWDQKLEPGAPRGEGMRCVMQALHAMCCRKLSNGPQISGQSKFSERLSCRGTLALRVSFEMELMVNTAQSAGKP